MMKKILILFVLFAPKVQYAQLPALGVQVDIGTSNTDFGKFNQFIDSSGLNRLDEFSYNRSIGLILFLNELSIKAAYNLSEYISEKNTSGEQLQYTNWQLNGSILKKVINRKVVSAAIGLGVSFSNSNVNYFSASGSNPFTGNTGNYFYMSRNNNVGFRGEANLLVTVFRSANSKHQLLAGLNTAYAFFFSHNDWVNVAGNKISNTPEVKDNAYYLNLALVYVFTNHSEQDRIR